jgi:hypothetical protein
MQDGAKGPATILFCAAGFPIAFTVLFEYRFYGDVCVQEIVEICGAIQDRDGKTC